MTYSWTSRSVGFLADCPRPPGGRPARRLRLLPDQLASKQEADIGQQARYMVVEGQIRLSPNIGDIYGDPAPGLENPIRLSENALEKAEILVEAEILVVVLADVVRR